MCKMNTDKAIKILRNIGYSVEILTRKQYKIQFSKSDPEIISARELIKRARIYSSDNKQTTSIKKNIKKIGKRKNRAKTKQIIYHEQFEKLDNKKPVYKEDHWNWD